MLYLLYGSDEYTRTQALQSLRAIIPPDLLNLNSSNLDGRKINIQELAVACEAVPFLSDYRLVTVYDALKHTKAGKDRDALRDYLARVPDTCYLIFVEREEVDKRSTLFTYLKKHGEVHEYPPLQGAELIQWLTQRAKDQGVKIERAAAQHLVDYVGSDSRQLMTELEKLAAYVGQKGTIRTNMVDLLVQDSQEHNLFAFIDDLSLRKQGAGLQGLHALLREGQAPTYILFMLARQVRILLSVQELVAQRMHANDIAARLRQKPFVVRKAMDQIRGFNKTELRTLHDRLLELDRATKTGRIRAEVALDLLVMEICEKPAPAAMRHA
jgi:DNA polymerase-3 subunit delta